MSVKKKSVQVVAGLVVALLCCCGLGLAQDTTFNFMPGTNFGQFHTFKWVTIPGAHTLIRLPTRRSKMPLWGS